MQCTKKNEKSVIIYSIIVIEHIIALFLKRGIR